MGIQEPRRQRVKPCRAPGRLHASTVSCYRHSSGEANYRRWHSGLPKVKQHWRSQWHTNQPIPTEPPRRSQWHTRHSSSSVPPSRSQWHTNQPIPTVPPRRLVTACPCCPKFAGLVGVQSQSDHPLSTHTSMKTPATPSTGRIAGDRIVLPEPIGLLDSLRGEVFDRRVGAGSNCRSITAAQA